MYYEKSTYSVRVRENTDQKKRSIQTLFMQFKYTKSVCLHQD